MPRKVTPHTLRHTDAMTLFAAGIDTTMIAMWLGHEHTQTTQIYLHGDLTIKERALAPTAPLTTRPAATNRPTPSSRSSKHCDYPGQRDTNTAPGNTSPTAPG
jgi:hypothetical protein